MSAIEHKSSAAAYCNGDLILIMTNSGRGRMQFDPDAPPHFLPLDASDETLGNAVFAALSRSREIALEEIATFFDLNRTMKVYADWVADLMSRYGYKSRRALFKGMKHCLVQRTGESIRFEPMRQVKLEAWEGIASHGAEDVVVPAASVPAEVGAAFRMALARCR